MRKKLFTLLLAVAASVGTMFAWDYERVQIGDLYYNLDATNQTAEVTSQNSSYPYWSTTITTAIIPASVEYNSVTYSVTSIGDYAFQYCTGLTSVTIPNSVTSIRYYAFWNCTGLTSVTIGNSVTSIGDNAFQYCTGLTSLTISNSVTSIGDWAFEDCSGLTSVTIGNSVTSIGNGAFSGCTGLTSVIIPNSVTSIGEYAFYECTGLTSIIVETSNLNYCSVEGVLFNKDKTTLIKYPEGKQGAYTIPNSITSIGRRAFFGCTGLTSVTIPNSVTNIGNYAFNGCTGLTAIYVPCGEMERFKQMLNNDSRINDHAPLPYTITINAEHGNVTYPQTMCDDMSLNAIPDYDYRFVQWSDGVTDNPRTIELTRDTTFTAEFAIDKTGNCGDDNALTWTYDAETKTLTITGNGTLNSNYTFGIEAPTQMQKLVIGNEITSIGDSAFYGMSTINHLIIGGSVAIIGNYAFAECRNFDDITCYATTVPIINETTFANVGNKQYIYLFVPEARERAYHRDTYWGEFDIQIKEAETTTTDGDVVVVPTDNTAEISWPTVTDADTYEIEISKDGVVVCVLKFNTNGQLVGIAFAPGRNGANYTQQAQTAGFKFTVTGLTSGTRYGYTIAAKDALEQTVDAKSGTFTTTIEGVTTDIDQVIVPNSDQITNDPLKTTTKLLRNGQIFILRGDRTYTLTGAEVK